MIVYTKYSNERSRAFCIRTEIEQMADGTKLVRKAAAFPEAEAHIQSIAEKYEKLNADLKGSGLSLNECLEEHSSDAVCFPFLDGRTLEEKLDGFLQKKQTAQIEEEIRRYFAMFEDGVQGFEETEAFRKVFGPASFSREQKCRRISDIDLIFSNAIEEKDGYTLIDYEWTFDFPVPVRFLKYRCLYYYLLGNTKREPLLAEHFYEKFDITKEEQEQFAGMERKFQQYMLGTYTPVWKLYDDISDGVIPVRPLIEETGREHKAMQTVEVFFDDGRGFGTWSCKRFQMDSGAAASIRIELPEGTKALRIDPCEARSIVRVAKLMQRGTSLEYTTNGEKAPNHDLIFDTDDPQILIGSPPYGTEPVEFVFSAEPMKGLAREVILNQNGVLRWMEQTRVWRLYRKLKGKEKGRR